MSGTSLDGIDAALVRLAGDRPDVELLGFHTVPYSESERRRILDTIECGGVRECALLHVDLGRRFAEVALEVLELGGRRAGELAFVASHGQTVWHEPGRASLQLADPAVIAESLGVQVVSDFRSRDVAAGGQGAPLVPMADALLFAARDRDRALLNLGGIANVTWVPAGGSLDCMIAFDTGPGVAVIDAVVRASSPEVAFDVDGVRARRGTAHAAVVEQLMQDPFFEQAPPKSTGRERFGPVFAKRLSQQVARAATGTGDDDAVATAVALTAASVADQFRRWLPAASAEVVVSGGGARNPALWDALRTALGAYDLKRFDDLFFDGDAKEAVAFALLGWLTLRGRPGNVPAATGARGPRVLGRITPGV